MASFSITKKRPGASLSFREETNWPYYFRLLIQFDKKSLETTLQKADTLLKAKTRLKRSAFLHLLENMDYDESTVNKYIVVARDRRFRVARIQELLPPEISKLHLLTMLQGDTFERALLTPQMNKRMLEFIVKDFKEEGRSQCITIHRHLGEFKKNNVFHVESVEASRTLSNQSVDLLISDLPCGLTRSELNNAIPAIMIWTHFQRLVKPGGAIVFIVANPVYAAKLIVANEALFWDKAVWWKSNVSNFMNAGQDRGWLRVIEDVLVFSNGTPTTFNPQFVIERPAYYKKRKATASRNYGACHSESVTENDGFEHPDNVLAYNSERGEHETQKPVALLRYLIETFSNEGQLVFDPFAGSGTAGVACIESGRDFLLFEKDRQHYETAKARIDDAIRKNRTK